MVSHGSQSTETQLAPSNYCFFVSIAPFITFLTIFEFSLTIFIIKSCPKVSSQALYLPSKSGGSIGPIKSAEILAVTLVSARAASDHSIIFKKRFQSYLQFSIGVKTTFCRLSSNALNKY